MNCQETEELIHAYLDGELDLARSLELEQHLKACPACSRIYQDQQALRAVIASRPLYFEAPSGLPERVRSTLRQASGVEARPSGRRRWTWNRGWDWPRVFVPLAVAALVCLIALPWFLRPSVEDRMAQEVVSAHVRSLIPNHLTDVASSDQHTVKPWFNGKLTFAPPVADPAAQGFPLVGGRLDYLGDHPVAALVYQRRKHFINLFIWPSSGRNTKEEFLTRRGYNVIHWTEGGMDCWAVSDVNQGDLQEFARLVRSEEPARNANLVK